MKPLQITAKLKESIFNLAKRAIDNATVYNKLVVVNDEVIIYPNDNFNSAMIALKFNQLNNTIKSLKQA